jgi:hypothetical protein
MSEEVGVVDFLVSFLGGGAGAALIGFLAKDWLSLRIKDAIESESAIRRDAFTIKRDACIDALNVIDGALSNQTWTNESGQVFPVTTQSVSIEKARECYSKLALTCENPKIIELYSKCLGLRLPGEPAENISTDNLLELRNYMRKELGFGATLDFDRRLAWIASLDGATPSNNAPQPTQ